MAKKKIKIGVLFGGKSAEHEVSLQSAKNVIKALDKDKYQIAEFKIAKSGKFNFDKLKNFDVVFPVLHGPFGEDGSMQGLLKLAGVPFVGAGVLGSAVGMDKDVMKRLLRDTGLPVPKFLILRPSDKVTFKEIKKKLGMPVFVKPANLGSSVGISKVRTESEWVSAIKNAGQFDSKIIVEEFIKGREIECAVLGNDNPIASIPGEIVVNSEFYSYEAKYIDEEASRAEIPAKNLSKATIKKIQELAIKTFLTLNCEGMGRVDFFLTEKGEIFVNEINTIPGFTNISMYPKLWAATGIPQTKLLDRLIDLAIERFEREQKLKTTV